MRWDKTLLAVLLVALLEFVTIAVETNGWDFPGEATRHARKYSIGFPVNCLTYTIEQTTGNLPSWRNYPDKSEWQPGVRVFPTFALLDLLGGASVFIVFRWLLDRTLGSLACVGVAIGFIMGILTIPLNYISEQTDGTPATFWCFLLLFWIGPPLITCVMTRRFPSIWPSLFVLTIVALSFPPIAIWAEQMRWKIQIENLVFCRLSRWSFFHS